MTPPAQQALEAILSADIGAELDSVELDGRVHRFKVRGDKARQKSGWYKLFGDRLPAGAFGSWRGDVCIKWHAHGTQLLTDADREEIEAIQARVLYEREQEAKRQQAEEGKRKTYRGLPVTSISMIYPVIALLQLFLPAGAFRVVLHIVMAATAFAFVLDFSVKKPDFDKLLSKHT